MKKTLVALFISAAFATVLVYSCSEQKPDEQKALAESGRADAYDPNPAMNNPDKFAWELFVKISQPYTSSLPEGKTVWESWISAPVLFKNPNQLPDWQTPNLKSNATQGSQPEITPLEETDETPLQLQRLGISPHTPEKLKNLSGNDDIGALISETRLNKALYDFIAEHDLYYQEGIEAYLKNHEDIQTPIESMEIKATWKPISEGEKAHYHYRYFTNKNGETELRGLTGLHVISKDIPQWTWATFEHKDNTDLKIIERLFPRLKSVDRFGKNAEGKVSDELKALFRQAGMDPKWENYILRGTQINYTDNKGKPTLLGNTQLENSFMLSSSCITCHARSSYGGTMEFADLPKEIQEAIIAENPRGQHYFNGLGFGVKNPNPLHPQYDAFLTHNGSPKPEWFIARGRISNRLYTYKQLDFIWSFTRAKRRTPYQAP